MSMLRFGIGISALAVLMVACSPAPQESTVSDAGAQIDTAASTIDFHSSIAVLDTHLDTPRLFHTPDYFFAKRASWDDDGTHVDLPRMNEGGLDGGFWVIFTPQRDLDEAGYETARTSALMRQTAIREFAAKYHDDVALAFSADEALQVVADGKKVVLQSMENAYPLGTDLSLLEYFYFGGLRMLGPVHSANNQFADSATDSEQIHNGLSPQGELLVREANRLGIILDGSHASDKALQDMIALSNSPVVLSHTGANAIHDHPRNIPDTLLTELANSGGVIQMNIFGAYLEELQPSAERVAALEKLKADAIAQYGSFESMPKDTARAAMTELNKSYPAPRSTYEKFMQHSFHVLELIGPDHVGISGDWDGGGGVDGMSDVSMLQRITNDLLQAGYSETDVANIWGGNVLRLMRAAETARTTEITSPNVLN